MAKGWQWVKHINSHERFVHDSIDNLGYDWSRVAEPGITPQYPLRVYLPQTTDDVVRIVKEARELGVLDQMVVRAHGHSSNDLVVRGGGTVLLTEKMNRVLDVNPVALTATVQPGCQSADVDDVLASFSPPLGFLVIGDHAHVTTGGFASVGGISASSFLHGLFVDLVEQLEYVTWDGEVVTCSRTDRPEHFNRVLLGLGRYGVITALTIRIERVDKYRTLWRNHQTHYRSLDDFLAAAERLLGNPPPWAKFMRGMWVDAGRLGIGQFSVYGETASTPQARLANDAAYAFLDGIGYVSGRLPGAIDRALKYVGLAGIVFAPPYALQKNAESFSDKILDATVGDPTRYLVAIVRESRLDEVSRRVLTLLKWYRDEQSCFKVITLYLKGIKSPTLAAGRAGDDRWAEVLFYVSIDPKRMTDALLDRIVEEIDDVCIDTGSFRYMHSRTTRDPGRRRLLDPHTLYEEAQEAGDGT